MPSIFGHGAVGVAVSFVSHKRLEKFHFFKLTLLSFVVANLPDIDVLFYHAGPGHIEALAHRNFCHSIFFAALLGPILGFLSYSQESTRRRWIFSGYFFALIMSHNLLDALRMDVGVGIFYPVIKAQISFPMTPLLPAGFTMAEYKAAALREVLVVWLPSLAICLGSKLLPLRQCQ